MTKKQYSYISKTTEWFYIILSFLIIGITFTNCENSASQLPPKDFTKLNWLLGHWEINKGSEYETWYQLNDSTFFGRNFRVYHHTDTLITETFQLTKRGHDIFYIPTVKTPTGDINVMFQLTSDSDTHFVFENPKHDFPKKISYTRIDNKTAKTQIEGGKRKLEYRYNKLN